MSVISWENPPEKRHKWADIAKELQARPNEWAKVAEATTTGAASNLKKCDPRIRIRTVSVGNGKSDLYAQFVP